MVKNQTTDNINRQEQKSTDKNRNQQTRTKINRQQQKEINRQHQIIIYMYRIHKFNALYSISIYKNAN